MKLLRLLVLVLALVLVWGVGTASASPYVSYSWNIQGPYYTPNGYVWDAYINWVYVDAGNNCYSVISTNAYGGNGGSSGVCTVSQKSLGWGYYGSYWNVDFYSPSSTHIATAYCTAGATC